MKRAAPRSHAGWHHYRRWGVVVIIGVLAFAAYSKLLSHALAPAPAVVGLGLDGLVGASGTSLDAETLRGRYQLLSFGYTQCPDRCPATLMKIRALMSALEPTAHVVVPVFVSVDPEHDSPDLLDRYVRAFDARILAVTGDRARIDAYAKSYGALGAQPQQSGDTGHASHAVGLLLVAPNHEILATYDLATPTPLIAQDIQRRVAARQSAGLALIHGSDGGHSG